MHNNNKYSFNFISIQPYVHFIFLGLMLVFFPLTASATSCDDFKTLSYTSNEQVKEDTVTSEDEDFCIHQVVPDSIVQGSGYELADCKAATWNELSDCLAGKGYTVGFEAVQCPSDILSNNLSQYNFNNPSKGTIGFYGKDWLSSGFDFKNPANYWVNDKKVFLGTTYSVPVWNFSSPSYHDGKFYPADGEPDGFNQRGMNGQWGFQGYYIKIKYADGTWVRDRVVRGSWTKENYTLYTASSIEAIFGSAKQVVDIDLDGGTGIGVMPVDGRGVNLSLALNITCSTLTVAKAAGMCPVLSGARSEVQLLVDNQIKTDDLLLIPTTQTEPSSGNIKAFAIEEDGGQSSEVKWDANAKMNIGQRRLNLYAVNTSGKMLPLDQLSESDFNVATPQEATIIRAYTLEPNYENGNYLAGRASNSFIGSLSRGNSLQLLSNKIDTGLYLDDVNYRSYAKTVVKERKPQALFTSDDGFLYSLDHDTGTMSWGWMPQSLLKELQNYQGFQNKKSMLGHIDILDLKDKSNTYSPYVVGSYQSGKAHYVLKLQGSDKEHSLPDSIVWDEDNSDQYSSSVNRGKKAYFNDASGYTYAVYLLRNKDKQSVLKIRSLTDNSLDYTIVTDQAISATPYITEDYKSRLAPAKKTLYLGTEKGEILAIKLVDSAGAILKQSDLESALNDQPIATMSVDETEGVDYVGIIYVGKSGYILRSQTANRLTVHRYDNADQKWYPLWTSAAMQAGYWDEFSSYIASDTAPQNKEGHAIVPISGKVQALPEGAVITDEAYVVSNNLVLPVTIADESACAAYYYLYDLSNGFYPDQNLYDVKGELITNHLHLGNGMSSKLILSDLASKSMLLGYGKVDQKVDGSIGISTVMMIKSAFVGGIRSWRLVEPSAAE